MKIAVFGGTGFVGNYLIDELIKNNYKLNVLVRSGNKSKLENKDKCTLFIGDISNRDVVEEIIKNSDVVIYNIGIIREFKSIGITYEKLHYQGAKLTIDISKKYNIHRFILMSANGVDQNRTNYQITKLKSEVYLKNNIKNWTIIRPSLIFGDPNGKKEFCSELKKDMLSLPLPAPAFFKGLNIMSAGKFEMSPIHIKDVAVILVKSINNCHAFKKIYDLGGEKYNWKEIIKIISKACNKNKFIIPAPTFFIYGLALLFDKYAWFPISRDQLSMLLMGNVCDSRTLFKRYNIIPIKFNYKSLDYL